MKIDIHDQLYKWRQVIVKEGYAPAAKKVAMKGMASVLASPKAYSIAGKLARWTLKHTPFVVQNKLNPWYGQREMPEVPEESFKEWFVKNRKQ